MFSGYGFPAFAGTTADRSVPTTFEEVSQALILSGDPARREQRAETSPDISPDIQARFPLARERTEGNSVLHPSAAAPALAICSSSCEATPETPIAPTHSSRAMIGTAPWIKRPAGKLAKAGRSLTRSSKNLLGRLVIAAVRALPIATSAEIGATPSMRLKCRR